MVDPMMFSSLPLVKSILFNPYLLTLTGIGWIWIITSHFKIHWRIKNHIKYWNTCRKATNEELQEWIKDAIDPRWSKLNPSWNKAIINEFKKRKLVNVTQKDLST
jgi:hypothetical protein